METLQDAYRDEDDDTETTSTESNPNPNPISDPNTSEPPSVVPPTLTPEPDPKPDPMSVETADLATDAEPMVVELSENPEAAGKVEPLGSEEGGGKVGALGSEEGGGNVGALGSEEGGGKVGALGSEEGGGKVEPLGSEGGGKVEPLGSEDVSSDSVSEGNKEVPESSEVKRSEEGEGEDMEEDEETMEGSNSKKRKSVALDQLQLHATATEAEARTPSSSAGIFGNVGNVNVNGSKKSSKKKSKGGNSVWTKPTSRKGKKKAKNNGNANNNQNNGSTHATPKTEDAVLVTPMPRYPDKNDDTPEAKICLSKVYKAEKVELGEDRLSAGSCKGYRMVRATRGVSEGAWFFEIKVVHLGESGHTRLGWSTEKGDLQAPVGYDRNSFGYRDNDGSKVHKALREKYGEEGYKEGDVIGFYISLPEGDSFAPKAPHLVMYKGQKYVCSEDSKEEPTQSVPGSEISFFKNGVCQGVAFKDISGGHYYPAASMYTLPNQANCVVKFNFGPDFECFPTDFEGRPVPRPMIEVPYHGHDNRVENGVSDENKQ